MTPQLNKHYFGRRFNEFAIWQYTAVNSDGSTMSRQVKCVETYDEAVTEVYRLNGWGTPKSIKRNF